METFHPKITPFLWFNGQAEEAVNFYTGIFPNSSIGKITRYESEGAAVSGQKEGSVMTIAFELEGQHFIALNGGHHFKFTEAISFVIQCESQQEVDRYWDRLSDGGEKSKCGWLKDRFGLSWQVVPTRLQELLMSKDKRKSKNVMQEMLTMDKIDINRLEQVYTL